MAAAPDGEEVLTLDDAARIVEELVEAINHAHLLGMVLEVKVHEVEAILKKHQDPKNQLLYIIIAFLQQTVRPTWRIIVNALRSPLVGLLALASRVETAHVKPLETNCETPEESLPGELSTPHKFHDPSSAEVGKLSGTIEEVNINIKILEKKFDDLKDAIKNCLQKRKIIVKKVADVLTSLSADEDKQHKMFVKDHIEVLFRAADVWELFGTMNFHWNYLNPPLLDHLVQKLELDEVKKQMAIYKSDLYQFIVTTPLIIFCKTQKRRRLTFTPEFEQMVVEFDWPENITLEAVDDFREVCASELNLRDCAMLVAHIRPGSFIVTWIIPKSIGSLLKNAFDGNFFKEHSIIRFEIAGEIVYPRKLLIEGDQSGSVCKSLVSTSYNDTKISRVSAGVLGLLSEDIIPFQQELPQEYICPVTKGILLQPHLTSCCGNHLSKEAAARIHGEGKACPLCAEQSWNTMLNKHFQRLVYSLRVFCRYEDRGCGWQGELVGFERHVKHCPMSKGPLVSELLQLPVYKNGESSAPETKTLPLTKTTDLKTSSIKSTSHHLPNIKTTKLSVQYLEKKVAPQNFVRGAATSDGQSAYLSSAARNSLYKYEYATEKWETLPSCLYHDSGLVVLNGELVTVGGADEYHITNHILTLRQKRWIVDVHPPMTDARSAPAVVTTCNNDYIIVIGGMNCNQWTTSVELYEVKKKKWYKATPLPQPLFFPSVTICGDELNVIGNETNGYSCSLQTITDIFSSIWTPLPRLPVKNTVAITLCGQFILIGGEKEFKAVNSIYQLIHNEWVEIGCMARKRNMCLTASISPDKILIFGGNGPETDVVETCVVV